MTSFLTSSSQKKLSAEELIKATNESLSVLLESDSSQKKNEVSLLLTRYLSDIKQALSTDNENITVEEDRLKDLSTLIQQENLLIKLINNLSSITFESKKDTTFIYGYLMKKDTASFSQHIINQIDIVRVLFEGYSQQDIALTCGCMLRESLKYIPIAEYLLYSSSFWKFFDIYLNLPNFDIASDAFNTLKELLTSLKVKSIVTEFFEKQYEMFLQKYEVSYLYSSRN